MTTDFPLTNTDASVGLSRRPVESVKAAIILAGGTARRLGGVSKPDYEIAGKRLLDLLFDELERAGFDGQACVVGPPDLTVPTGARLTLEDPPFGGPLAGIAAGVAVFDDFSDDDGVLLATCDAPLVPRLLPDLACVLQQSPSSAGVIPTTNDTDPWPQYTHGLYRLNALRQLPARRDASIKSAFGTLELQTLIDKHNYCFDVDTPESATQLLDRLSINEK